VAESKVEPTLEEIPFWRLHLTLPFDMVLT
jgi:hypothetical protein